MTESMISHPQFGIAKLLQPYPQFAQDYENEDVNHPIMFTENGIGLDPQAGKPGYSDHFVKGTPVPLGARVILYIPLLKAFGSDYDEQQPSYGYLEYKWRIIWRLRNVYDYRTVRMPWHATKLLANDETLEVMVPAIGQPIVYNQVENTNDVTQLTHLKAIEDIVVSPETSHTYLFNDLLAPYVRNTTGVRDGGAIQQGWPLAASKEVDDFVTPRYYIYETQALGDEMLLGAYRSRSVVDNNGATQNMNTWWFLTDLGLQTWDRAFYQFFSTLVWDPTTEIWVPARKPGVYMTVGSAS